MNGQDNPFPIVTKKDENPFPMVDVKKKESTVSEGRTTTSGELEFLLPELPQEIAKKSTTYVSYPTIKSDELARQIVAPMSMKQLQDVLKKPQETAQDKLAFQIKQSAKEHYTERGFITPDDKIASFNYEIEEAKKTATRETFPDVAKSLADKWGLDVSEVDGQMMVTVPKNEIDQYREVLEKKIKSHLKNKAISEKDPFYKSLWNSLNNGSERLLNSVFDIMAVSEKVGNLILSPISEKSTYYKDMAIDASQVLAKKQADNDRYESDILGLVESGQTGAAIGQTVLSVAENLPMLALLASGNAAGFTRGTLAYMGAATGAEKYLKLEQTNPEMSDLMKVVDALGTGLSEVVFENVGTVRILDDVKRAVQKSGETLVRQELQKTYQTFFEKKIGLLMKGVSPMVREGSSELATEITNNIMDMAVGNEDVKILDNAFDAFAVGALIGGGLSSPTLLDNRGKYVKSMINALPKDLSLEDKEEFISLLVQYDAVHEARKDAGEFEKKEFDGRLNEIHTRTQEILKRGVMGEVEEEIKTQQEKEFYQRIDENIEKVDEEKKQKLETFANEEDFVGGLAYLDEVGIKLEEKEQLAKESEKVEEVKPVEQAQPVYKQGKIEYPLTPQQDKEYTDKAQKATQSIPEEFKSHIDNFRKTGEMEKFKVGDITVYIYDDSVNKTPTATAPDKKNIFINLDHLSDVPGVALLGKDNEYINSYFGYLHETSHLKDTEDIIMPDKWDEYIKSPQEKRAQGLANNWLKQYTEQQIKEEPQDAETIRIDKGITAQEGIIPEGSKDKGGEDIQLPKEEGAEAGDKKLRQVKTQALSAKSEKLSTTLSVNKFNRENVLDWIQGERESALEDLEEADKKSVNKVFDDRTKRANKFFDDLDASKIKEKVESKSLKKARIIREILSDYIKDNRLAIVGMKSKDVPVAMTAIKNASTWGTLTKALDKIDNLVEKGEALNLKRDIVKSYIDENKAVLSHVYGRKIPSILKELINAKDEPRGKKATPRIDKVMRRMEDMVAKQVELEEYAVADKALIKIFNLLNPNLLMAKKSIIKRAKIPQYRVAIKRLNRIRDLVFNKKYEDLYDDPTYKDVMQKVTEMGQDALTAEEYDLYEESQFAGLMKESTPLEGLVTLSDELERILNGEKSTARQKYEAEKVAREASVQENVDDILGKKELVKESGKPKPKKTFLGKVRDTVSWVELSSLHSLLDMLGSKQGGTVPYDTRLNNKYGTLINEANGKFYESRTEALSDILTSYTKVFGKKWAKIEQEFKQPKITKYKDEFGKEQELELSQEQAGYLYAAMQDENLHPTFAGKEMRYMKESKDDEGKVAGEYELTNKGKALMKFLDPNMKKWADTVVEKFEELYDKYNETYEELTGRDMPKHGKYIPLFRKTDDNINESVEDMFRKMNLVSVGNSRHIFARTGSTLPLKEFGITETLVNYINSMERFKAYGKPLRTIKGELLNRDVRTAIEQEYGKKGKDIIDVLQDFVNDLGGNPVRGKQIKILDNLRINVTRAMLGFKPSIGLKQITSFPAYAQFVPIDKLVSGIGNFFANAKTATKILMNSPYIKERWGKGFDRDQVEAMVKEYNAFGAKKYAFMNVAMAFIKGGDIAPILVGGWAVYKYNYDQKYKEEQTRNISDSQAKKNAEKYALEKFELATKYTQQSSMTDDLSYYQRNSSVSKLFTMYATAPYSYIRLVNAGVRRIMMGDVKQGLKAVVLGHIILPVIFRAATLAFKFDADDDEWWKDLAEAAIFGPFDSMFILGDAIQFGFDLVRGRPFDYQITPAAESVENVVRSAVDAGKEIGKILDGDLSVEDVLKISDDIAAGVSLGTGYPYEGARNYVVDWYKIINGDISEPPDVVRSILGFKQKKGSNKVSR